MFDDFKVEDDEAWDSETDRDYYAAPGATGMASFGRCVRFFVGSVTGAMCGARERFPFEEL